MTPTKYQALAMLMYLSGAPLTKQLAEAAEAGFKVCDWRHVNPLSALKCLNP